MGSSQLVESFERRAARAELLAPQSSSAAEPLRFAAKLLRAQGRCAGEAAQLALSGEVARDAQALLPALTKLSSLIAESAPDALAAQAAGPVDVALLEQHWRGEKTAAPYLARALLRPWAEALADAKLKPSLKRSGPCALCGAAPSLAIRRALAESEGAARFLFCALCGTETPMRRILCPHCGEEDPARLPSWSAETWPAARIEACESCRTYVKSIDLTVDARPLAEVDDLLSIGLDLWAQEQGLQRLEPGLAGV